MRRYDIRVPLIIIGLFDGISCGQAALKRILPKNRPYIYYALEINTGAIKITMHNFPKTIQLGDVRKLTRDMIPYGEIFLVMGGSPCQSFSLAGKRLGMTTEENVEVTTLSQYLKLKEEGFQFKGESYLYWEFVRIVEEFKPKHFLLENVIMDKKWRDIISDGLGVTPIRINSSLVSAQFRDRDYWTNIPGVEAPEDRKIFLPDVINKDGKGFGIRNEFGGNYYPDGKKKWDKPRRDTRKNGKANCVTCKEGNTAYYILPDQTICRYTMNEIEVLQTLDKGYTDVPGLSRALRYKGVGNGWTVEVIAHILKYAF